MTVYNTLGLMSGTSLDGLDIVHVLFKHGKTWEFDIINAKTYSYSEKWVKKLNNITELNGEKLIELHTNYGKHIGSKVNEFIVEQDISRKNIDLLSSHGHTAFHQPKKGFTFQLGNGADIYATTNIKTICDFRSIDVAFGGQGAPLVPIGDQLLFNKYEACLNIGGIANISFNTSKGRIAGDIDFANIFSNRLAKKLEHEFDQDGHLANAGELNTALLTDLRQLAYYSKSFPKSLGIEDYLQWYKPILSNHNISINDQLHTCGYHLCENIASMVKENKVNNKVLCTGGGIKNLFWKKTLQKMGVNIIVPEKTTIDYKEALIFAFLGVLKVENKNNILSSVTGGEKNLITGIIYNSENS